MEKKKKKPIGKTKGNAEERKVAKQLSEWFFDDPNVLRRHPDSGMTKIAYCGDVVPVKQLIDYWEYSWPFIVEVKTGYKDFLPTFYNYKKITEWYEKAYQEGLINNQPIVLLIVRIKFKPQLLITNYYIKNFLFNVSFPHVNKNNNELSYIFVYDYGELLQYKPEYVFDMKEICSREN